MLNPRRGYAVSKSIAPSIDPSGCSTRMLNQSNSSGFTCSYQSEAAGSSWLSNWTNTSTA